MRGLGAVCPAPEMLSDGEVMMGLGRFDIPKRKTKRMGITLSLYVHNRGGQNHYYYFLSIIP
jgi:hypothetical protein